jgi:hypothetical protein
MMEEEEVAVVEETIMDVIVGVEMVEEGVIYLRNYQPNDLDTTNTTKKKAMVVVVTAATTRGMVDMMEAMKEAMTEAMMEDMDSADTIQHVDAAVVEVEVAVDLVDEEDEYRLVDEEMSLKVVLKVALLLPKEELKVPMKWQPMDKGETLLLVSTILLLWSKLLTVVVEGIVAEDVLEDVEEVEDDSGVDTMLLI